MFPVSYYGNATANGRRNFLAVSNVVAWMKLWGRALFLFSGLLVVTSAQPPLDPIPICDAVLQWKDHDGQPLAVIGRYSFRQAGPNKGRWLDQEGCSGSASREAIRLTLDPATAPKLAPQVVLDAAGLETQLAALKKRTRLGTFRFGSSDYDRWAVVYGSFRRAGEHEFQLVYRGDGAIFFLPDK